MDDAQKDIVKKFKAAVNMSASELDAFLKTEDSKKAGQKFSGNSESIGHESGRHIVAILHKSESQYTAQDFEQMKRTYSYVARHSAQGGPKKDKETSYWRYSLMNWGHDPIK